MQQFTYSSLIAMADMSRTPYAIAVLLVMGVVALRFLRPANSEAGLWLPVAAFVAGPILALGYFAADVVFVSRDYITTDDYFQSLIPILIIGLIGGTVGSISLWAGEKLKLKRPTGGSKHDRLDSNG